MGLVTFSNPVISSRQNNCTVLGLELETYQHLIFMIIPDLDLVNLSLWLVDFNAVPVVTHPFGAAIGSIPQSELVLDIVGYFTDGDKIVFVIELVDGWEVSVLLAVDWFVRFCVSPGQFVGK